MVSLWMTWEAYHSSPSVKDGALHGLSVGTEHNGDVWVVAQSEARGVAFCVLAAPGPAATSQSPFRAGFGEPVGCVDEACPDTADARSFAQTPDPI